MINVYGKEIHNRMLTGIQVKDVKKMKYVQESDFENVELTLEGLDELTESGFDILAAGIRILSVTESIEVTTRERWERILGYVEKYAISYIIIETKGIKTVGALPAWIADSATRILELDVKLCVENGYYEEYGHFAKNNVCDSHEILHRVTIWNRQMGFECFKVAINTGYANLFGYNIGALIEELMNYVVIIHANDNDGIHDLKQLPYTFTTGRGALSTGWPKIVWSLTKIQYDGEIIFDVAGLLANTPDALTVSMLKLLYTIYEEWESQIHIEERLSQPGKKLILFGAGAIFQNYMCTWGEAYPPAFCVDNNSKIWGEKRLGVEVKSPQAILEIPEEERNVWICNLYYREITEQLCKMGVSAQWFDDQYIL